MVNFTFLTEKLFQLTFVGTPKEKTCHQSFLLQQVTTEPEVTEDNKKGLI